MEENDWPEVETVGLDTHVTHEILEGYEDIFESEDEDITAGLKAKAERKELYQGLIKHWKHEVSWFVQEEEKCNKTINENTFLVKDEFHSWTDYLDEDAVDEALERIKWIKTEKLNANFELATWVKALERLEKGKI
jgi:hypothetical protein